MREEILEAMEYLKTLEPDGRLDKAAADDLLARIDAVQRAYVDVIREALSLLVQDRQEESYQILYDRRQGLADVRERIAGLLSQPDRWRNPVLKGAVEYLFTRARLMEALSMFPNFGVQLLERLTIDESIEEMISYLERAMTGKRQLYERVRQSCLEIRKTSK